MYTLSMRASAGIAVIGMALSVTAARAQTAAPAPDTDWPSYAADLASSRYRPLEQINASNFNDLEVAWRFKTDNLGNRPEFLLEGTPLVVKGVLYATAGTRRSVIALDAATGELLWVHGEKEGARGAAAPRQLSGRGLGYWTDGKEERLIYVTPGYRLIALDAKTGQRVSSFGTEGAVDLKRDFDQELRPDIETGEVGLHAAPTIGNDVIVIGAAFKEGMTPKTIENTKGYVRGFDVRTGKRLWTFHTIPRKGEFGYETWLDGSAERIGNTGVWTQISIDEEAGLAYLPVESPSNDYYGGERPGNNLYGESLVAVDLKTGVRKWHFQFVHHPIWDQDMSSAALLMDVTVDGKRVKAAALPSKQGLMYAFDRVTGRPVWPIRETKVEKGDVPGEWYAPTQPIPSKPKPYARAGLVRDDLIDFTPALREQALALVQNYKLGPLYTPPTLSKQPGPLATLHMGAAAGGTNWPGGSFDPETGIAYVYATNSSVTAISLVPSPPEISDSRYILGVAGRPITIARGPGEGAGADSAPPPPPPPAAAGAAAAGGGGLNVQGLPLVKPPYNLLSAIDMNKGEILWQVPHGDTPDNIRNHPALKGLNIPKTGQSGYRVGTLVTKSLVIAGDPQVTTTPEHPRGAMLRAYDKKTGQEVGGVLMPAPQTGSPMTYAVNGRQYIVVAISGGAYTGEYVAYALPQN